MVKIILGVLMVLGGIVLAFFFPFLGIGLAISGISFIIFNRDEDTIEERQDLKLRGTKK